MGNRMKSFAPGAGAVAALAMAGLMAWAFSLEGTAGLFQWSAKWRSIFLALMALGALPLVVSLIALLLSRYGKQARVLSPVSIALSAITFCCAVGLFVGLHIVSRPSGTPPSLNLVDPSSGVPGSGGEVRLSLSSDPHWGSSEADAQAREAVLGSVAAAKPPRDALFILGDNVQYGMLESSWREEARELSTLLANLPVRPLLGNHDAIMGGQDVFYRIFFPAPLRTDSGSPFYWSMKAGPARIVVLDLLWGTETFTAAQAAWLERTLSSVPEGEQVVVLSHCFFYASGSVDPDGNMPWFDHFATIAEVAPILERHRVALVVSGHNHIMEHGGVTYAVVGAMGGKPDPEPTHVSPASRWFRRGTYGRLDLDIGAAGIALTFRDRDGRSLHEAFLPARR
jgi:hypothetical protein